MAVRLHHLGIEIVRPGPGDADGVSGGRHGAGRGQRLAIEGELPGEVVVDGGARGRVVGPGRGYGSPLGPVCLAGPANVLEGVAEGVCVVGRGPVSRGGEAGSGRVFVVVAVALVVVGSNAPLGAGGSEGLELSFVFKCADLD